VRNQPFTTCEHAKVLQTTSRPSIKIKRHTGCLAARHHRQGGVISLLESFVYASHTTLHKSTHIFVLKTSTWPIEMATHLLRPQTDNVTIFTTDPCDLYICHYEGRKILRSRLVFRLAHLSRRNNCASIQSILRPQRAKDRYPCRRPIHPGNSLTPCPNPLRFCTPRTNQPGTTYTRHGCIADPGVSRARHSLRLLSTTVLLVRNDLRVQRRRTGVVHCC
jgi:hypothetical protein